MAFDISGNRTPTITLCRNGKLRFSSDYNKYMDKKTYNTYELTDLNALVINSRVIDETGKQVTASYANKAFTKAADKYLEFIRFLDKELKRHREYNIKEDII